MKKLFLIFICLLTLFIISCGEKKEISLEKKELEVVNYELIELNPHVLGLENIVFEYEVVEGKASIEDGKVRVLETGTCKIKISVKDNNKINPIYVVIKVNPYVFKISGKDKIYLGEKTDLSVNNNSKNIRWESNNEKVVKVKNGSIEGCGIGKAIIKATLETDYAKFEDSFEIDVLEPKQIEIKLPLSGYVGEKIELVAVTKGFQGNIKWSTSDETIAIIENNYLVLKSVGEVTIKAVSEDIENSIIFTVNKPLVTSIEVTNPSVRLTKDSEHKIKYKVLPEAALSEVEFVSDDLDVAVVDENGVIKAVNGGITKVKIIAKDGSNVSAEIEVFVKDDIAPEIKLVKGASKIYKVEINGSFNPLQDIVATDNIDGDITNKVTYKGNVNTKKYGQYEVTYSVRDSSNNQATFSRIVEVYWPYSVKFIGHAGSFYGLMNSEEAIRYALEKLQYQAVEVDLKQTKDGVFVLSHDDSFAGKALASTNYDDLKNLTVTNSRKSGIPGQNGSVVNSPYTTKLCTLDTYLQLCKAYNAKAVIELKYSNGINNNDQSRMEALMEVIHKNNMIDNTIFLASQYKCLIWVREHGYNNIECQYLVNSCEDETILERCIKYNFSVSINVTGNASNSDEWLARYKENGLKISTYTFTQYVDYDVLQKWIDKGVDYVTCDWHIMSNLNLSKDDGNAKYNKVIFKDYDGTVLKETLVKEGFTAAPPQSPTRKGYDFIGWDKSIKNVREDLIVIAQYEIVKYKITYVDNLNEIKESSWESKSAFITEFYTDFYNWFIEKGQGLSGVTINDNRVSISLNGVNVSFDSYESILKIDIYDFEKTLSNFIYKPVVRNSDDTCVIELSEEYFLNSKKYKDKYQALDEYFINAINKGYPNYSKTYKPLSNGKIQIFFRFHQWAKGTTIVAFDVLPKKYIVNESTIEVILPQDFMSYTIDDEIVLSEAKCKYKFLGWYLNKECTGDKITKIEKGTTGNLILYAKWEIA